MTLLSFVQEIVDALAAAREHLEYCGYGDSWERECATDAKLPEKIDAALALARRLGYTVPKA